MSLQACADIVAAGDPDRFAAAMAVPVEARRALLPIYAFNVEVFRAPWVTAEPMIAEMRLQWWRDALDEIAQGKEVRRHEVTTPLADVLDADGAALLDRVVAARRWDVYSEPFEDAAHFDDYLAATGGALMCAAGRTLGGTDLEGLQATGRASALANLLIAVPDLIARGRNPLFDPTPTAIARQAAEALRSIRPVRDAGRMATLAGWRAPILLRRAARTPEAVLNGTLEESEFRKRAALLSRRLWSPLR